MDSMLNIVVVEDHNDLREVTVAALAASGHTVKGFACAEALDDELGGFRPDLLLLDLNLPGEDGLSLARRMRAAEPHLGIIMVTARDQGRDVTQGFGSGADMYLTKPISIEALNAAIQALARRLRPIQETQNPRMKLNLATLQLDGGLKTGKPKADLSNLECSLLLALARAQGCRLESWQLMEVSGKLGEEFNKAALEAQIIRLRKKMQQAGASSPTIKSIRGYGYQLCCPVEISNF